MRYLSLFSGIEACSVAWEPLGWEPVAFAEFDSFPKAVLKHHWPNVPDLDDVTKITAEDLEKLGPFELLVGGSPCQDLSVAGKRAGLRNEDGSLTRSGLFDHQMRIFELARKINGCRFCLWENVPGAFSSNEGRDFAYVLGSMVQGDVPVPRDGWCNSGVCVSESGHRIVEWAVLDAQYVGIPAAVPQRRRRIFALCDTGAWWSRPPILFEPESLSRDSVKGRETQEGSSSGSSGSSDEDCLPQKSVTLEMFHGETEDKGIAQPLRARDYKDPQVVAFEGNGTRPSHLGAGISDNGVQYTLNTTEVHAVAFQDCGDRNNPSVSVSNDKAFTLQANAQSKDQKILQKVAVQMGHTKGNGHGVNYDGKAYSLEAVGSSNQAVFSFDAENSNSMKSDNPNSGGRFVDKAKTVDCSIPDPSKRQGGLVVMSTGDNAHAKFTEGNEATGTVTSRIGLGYLMEKKGDGDVIAWKNRDRMSKPHMGKADPITATDYKEPDLVGYEESYVWDHSMMSGTPKAERSDTLTATLDRHPFVVGSRDA